MAGRVRDIVKVGAEASADAVGGLVALAATSKVGPVGAVAVGAATTETLRHLAERAIDLRESQAERTIEIAAAIVADEAGLSLDELRRRLTADPSRLQLTAAALAAAADTALEVKLRTLARALATGALAADTAKVDEQRVLVETLADLEAFHVRVLHQLSLRPPSYEEARSATGHHQADGWFIDDLAIELPGIAPALWPVLNVLSRHGLILDTAVGTLDYVPGSGRWTLTQYGEQCLALLVERGQEAPT